MMINRWSRALFCLPMCMVCSSILSAQVTWQAVSMRVNNEPMSKLRAVGIPAEAEFKGQKLKAFVFFYGREGQGGGIGYPNFGIYVEDIESIVPESEIGLFVGPDLSRVAVDNDAIKISIGRGDSQESMSTRLVYTGTQYFDTGFKTDGFFETNIRRTKNATDAWKHFLTEMGGGFEDGKAVIGGKAFSNELTVRFPGKGLSARLKELMVYCNN